MKRNLLKIGTKLFLIILALIPGLTILTKHAIGVFEGRDISYSQSFLFVIQTMTTTGYGELLPFDTWAMSLYAGAVMATGLILIFIILGTIAAVWLQSHLEEVPSRRVPYKTRNHVILCQFNPVSERLVEDLIQRSIPCAIIDSNTETIKNLMREDINTVYGDPSESDVLKSANIDYARALIVHDNSAKNVNIVLQARTMTDIQIIATAEDKSHKKNLSYAGANHVLTPKPVLGEELARWALADLPESLFQKTADIGDFILMEFSLSLYCQFTGKTLKESGIREKTGVLVLGCWRDGVFNIADGPNFKLLRNSIAVVLGTKEQLQKLRNIMSYPPRQLQAGSKGYLVGGYGDVGSKIVEVLKSKQKKVNVISKNAHNSSEHFYGDITNEGVLTRAGIKEVGTYVIAVSNDASAVYSTLIARELNPSLRIMARAVDQHSVERLYQAGADFVMSLPQIASKLMMNILTEEEGMQVPDYDIVFEEIVVDKLLAGKSVSESRLYSVTGCMVVALKRSGQLTVNPPADLELEMGDILIVLGSHDNVQKFKDIFNE